MTLLFHNYLQPLTGAALCDKFGVMQLTIDIPDELAGQLESERERLVEIIRRSLRPPSSDALSIADDVFEFLARRPSPEEIIAFRPSERSIERHRELLDKNRDGSLTAHEEAELDTLQSLNNLFALIKIQARQQLRAAS